MVLHERRALDVALEIVLRVGTSECIPIHAYSIMTKFGSVPELEVLKTEILPTRWLNGLSVVGEVRARHERL